MSNETPARHDAADEKTPPEGCIDLLHLSDLHFGPHSRFQGEDPRKLGERFFADLKAACQQLPISPKVDLVVVTGDLVETGRVKEFQDAEAFLTGLAGAMGIEHGRFVFVPGNHDISWPKCKIAEQEHELDEEKSRTLRERLDEVKLELFDNALLSFYGVKNLTELGASPLGRGAWLYEREVRGLALSIAALNSCERESHRDDDHVGEVSKAQVQTVLDRWLQPAADRKLKLIAVHHNPTTATIEVEQGWREWLGQQQLSEEIVDRFAADVAGFEGKEYLKRLCQDAHVQLLLHGHQHAKDEQPIEWQQDGRTYVLSAGSLSLKADKLPSEEPLSVRLIRLDARQRRLTAWPLTFIGWARTPGHLQRGAFTLDPAVGTTGYRQDLYLPSEFPTKALAQPPTDTVDRAAVASFVAAYRKTVAGAFSTWELAVASGMTSKQQASARLDAMYVPLRFEPASQSSRSKKAEPRLLEPGELLRRKQPLLISGVAGSGKTTWVRHTFRRLAGGERALPLMVELRKLASDWEHKAVQRSLLRYLGFFIAGYLGSGWKGSLERFLASREGPVPVLLVDGWDELGPLGTEVREKLVAFMAAHPRVQVVVTSRPFGDGRPSNSEGFHVWTVAPLDDGTVAQLCQNFYEHCHPEDDHRAVQDAADFLDRLWKAPDARALAGTPLLLTMLLMIGSREPLPEKRHQLYEICLRNLLWARPKQRAEQGVLQAMAHFWPEDSGARLRATAALALGVQQAGYERSSRSALPFTAEEAAAHLPKDLFRNRDQLAGFLAWLAEAAGVLTDRSDDRFQFAHLSFQEFLAAWQLHATHGDNRPTAFAKLGGDPDWWETLILWAALVQQQNPAWTDAVLAELAVGEEISPLAGAILADGLGGEDTLETWATSFSAVLNATWPVTTDACAERWKASRQHGRRSWLMQLHSAAAEACRNWLHWLRLDLFRAKAELGLELPRPPETRLVGALLAAADGEAGGSKARVASARILGGSFPLWPASDLSVGLLQLWPGARRLVGLQLQAAACMGADRADLATLAPLASARDEMEQETSARDWTRGWPSGWVHDWAHDWVRYWTHYRARYLARYWARDWARDLAHDWKSYWTSYWTSYWGRDWARDLVRDLARTWARDWARDLVRYWARDWARDLVRDWARDWAHEMGIDEKLPWLRSFALVELSSLGRAGARAMLANAKTRDWPEAPMLYWGVQKSLRPTGVPRIEEVPGLDPLWPALARHIGRCATDADRELLEDLARNPEKREPPLSWGLQFIVRGDVMLPGGEFVTLDELWAEAGIAPLPYLEEMPPELEIDWDNESDDDRDADKGLI